MPRANKDAATAANISLLGGRILRQAEKYAAQLCELATADGGHLSTVKTGDLSLHLRRAGKALTAILPEADPLPEQRGALMGGMRGMQSALLPLYVHTLIERCREGGLSLSSALLLPIREANDGRIAYMKSPHTDEAYESFAPSVKSPTAHYMDSYRRSAEEVAAGDADFCILPYENMGGPLQRFHTLAEQYSLCCVESCRVFHADGTDVTHFGLYARHFLPIGEHSAAMLSYSFPFSGEEAPADHLAALSAFGARITHMQCAPEEERLGMRARLTVYLPKNKLTPWLVYLAAFTDGYACHGLYGVKKQ
ncbi:MAG: hypothetical protein IJ012_06745 [Clostridia bacterium]|nr:hypothetical protein [Clostridia bacterium]